ncbi:MAG: MerR family transcriptional regulator [Sciscionella sp.]
MTIGQLARASGVPPSAIRFWERKGLLSPPQRQSGQRRYSEHAQSQIAVLKLCQKSGFTLAEVAQILDLRAHNPSQWRNFVKAKVVAVEDNLRRLEHAHDMLLHALECPKDDITQCPEFLRAVDARLR